MKPSSLICFSFVTYSIKICIHYWNVLIFTTSLTKFTEHWINCYTLRFILSSKVVMCTCWQIVFYVLSVAILNWGMGREKSTSSPNISYLPHSFTKLFATWSSSFISSKRHQLLLAVLVPLPQRYTRYTVSS